MALAEEIKNFINTLDLDKGCNCPLDTYIDSVKRDLRDILEKEKENGTL